MKIGYLGKENAFSIELLKQIKAETPQDVILSWSPGSKAPALDLDVLLAMGKVDAADLAGQTKLGLVQTASAGYDTVDVEAATEAGIWVASAPARMTGNGVSVAEFAILLLLAASRRLHEAMTFDDGVAPDWFAKQERNLALYGKTICIIGLGGIGELLVERLRGFGMVLSGVDLNPEHAPAGVKAYASNQLKSALTGADYVVLAIPGTKENENIIDAETLAAMKKGAVLVNISRGMLIDEPALIVAVKSGHMYAAGLDVVKNEPLRANDPLLSVPRLFVTPHIAGVTDVMLEGTAKYLSGVLADYEKGIGPKDTVNEPKQPRVPLRKKEVY